MSTERADRLRAISDRLSNLMEDIKSGKTKLSDDVIPLVDQLDTVVSKYEDIIDKENKMS
jgi:hypothetical protein